LLHSNALSKDWMWFFIWEWNDRPPAVV